MKGNRAFGANYRRVFAASVISNLGDGVAQIGYPWLASAVTRNPLLVAVVVVAQRLPWLLFTLPAGVITDRVDRRKAIIAMDVTRGLLTVVVALAVLGLGADLPEPDAIASVVGTNTALYAVLLVASLLLGSAEVLRDNSAQTIIPAIVETQHLERANGRMWSAEQIANTFVGPPLGSLMLAVSFVLPFAVDSVSFFASAALVVLVTGQFRAQAAPDAAPERRSWTVDLKEGVGWLWHHTLLRTLAIVLGCMNAIGMMVQATFVLFAQEVLDTTPIEFAILMMGGAVGGVIGGYAGAPINERLGSGPSLWLTLAFGTVGPIIIGLSSWWPLVFVVFAVEIMFGVVWNVITVSLRQTIIPDQLLGRVNSVYRFFGWGMMPIGTLIGGATVVIADTMWSRETALRAPYFVAAGLSVLVAIYAIPRLTTERLDGARQSALAAR